MPLSREELRAQARYIREKLGPLVIRDGADILHRDSLENVEAFFSELARTEVDIDILRFTRIDKALLEMSAMGSRWPTYLVDMAESTVREWEKRLGDIRHLRTALWAPSGRMVSKEKKGWLVDKGDPAKAHVVGHNWIRAGDWWIKPACAFRDGAIDNPKGGITADDDGAYAILLSGKEELEGSEPNSIIYRPDPTDPKRFKLMKNLELRMPVRMLRSWRLQSVWGPRAGVRYDGLYRVTGWSTKLEDGLITFTFYLGRNEDQPPMSQVMRHPTAEEIDDWKDYQEIKSQFRGIGLASPPSEKQWLMDSARDSGYFSRRASKE
ncbi:hypothetical protein L228DRAFT_281161 [Xylona heveae TC161]|uniref:YDG domain-containing protein n=1 Tax=Xylona heveae (strain CBS 132557 / TC161) TaxID=1328760 RepID=A0A165HX37_XYLHT|nr:hypothetical protein L228DRAFT_281161 [Xylona heveae TC161]KZF24049.1 hypothetical protein L228DRAFT_281161 [Xylona heveae TC161]